MAYFDTQKKNERIFDIYIPAVIAIASIVYSIAYQNNDIQFNFINEVIIFIGTLLGFTLAALTLLLSNNRIEETTRQSSTDNRKIRGKEITMYEYIVILCSHLIVCETILCIIFYVAFLFPIKVNYIIAILSNSIFIFGVFHVLFLTLRTVSNMYFIAKRR